MSVVKVWIHMVFATKNRQPLLASHMRREVFQHILKNGKNKGIEMDFVNGYYEHAHCLFQLPSIMSVAETAQLIKGESSHWINEQQMTEQKFFWQDDYYAESVSLNDVSRVREYIRNQEEHHKNLKFDIEIKQLEENGMKRL